MVATKVNDMPACSNADEFLKYCQLVKDSLINQDENGITLLMDEAKVFCESVLMKAKFCRTQDVENCPSFLLLKDGKGGAKFVPGYSNRAAIHPGCTATFGLFILTSWSRSIP